jgi:type VI secretion system protein ImpH
MTLMNQLPLREQLFAETERFAFAQIVDLLQQLDPSRAALGQGSDPGAEALRINAQFGLAFHAAPVSALRQGTPAALDVNFFGLGAAQGPLPEPYVELIAQQLRRNASGSASAGTEFLGMFHHRLLSFVYRSEAQFRVAAPFQLPEDGAFMPALAALLGLPTHPNQRRLARILLAHAPLVAQQRRSMSGLLALLGSHFGVPVGGSEFVGSWTELPDELQTVLGEDGRNDVLGQGAVLGERAWDPNGAIEIVFAPMPMALFARFVLLPDCPARKDLEQICGFYLGPQIRCYVQIALDVLPPQIGAPGPDLAEQDDPFALGRDGCLLGHTSWLRLRDPGLDPHQRCVTLVLNDGHQERP